MGLRAELRQKARAEGRAARATRLNTDGPTYMGLDHRGQPVWFNRAQRRQHARLPWFVNPYERKAR